MRMIVGASRHLAAPWPKGLGQDAEMIIGVSRRRPRT